MLNFCTIDQALSNEKQGFEILIYRNIFNCDNCIEGRNLSDDVSKLLSCSVYHIYYRL
jgi:hypothetical protein